MRFLFTTGGPSVPDIWGGAETSMHELIGELLARGHACELVSGCAHGRLAQLRHLGARSDQRAGYPAHRVDHARVPALLRARLAAFRPDVVVCWNRGCAGAAAAALDAGAAVLLWVPDVGFHWHRGPLAAHRKLVIAGCSAFVAGRIRDRLDLEARVLRPLIRFDLYRHPGPRGESVTLVNAHPTKGLEIALAVAARLPHREILLVDSWLLTRAERRDLAARVARLPNARLHPWVPRMSEIYRRTAVLLAPSQVEDASPRVILEAQASGIPAVASRIGGIPEILGDGGVLLDPGAPGERWSEAVEAVLADPAELAARAVANAARPELSPAAITDDFLAIAAAAASG